MTSDWLTLEEEEKWCAEDGYDPEKFRTVCSHCGKRKFRILRAPKTIEIEVWQWKNECYACEKKTRVVWPAEDLSGFVKNSLDLNCFESLPAVLSKKYPFVKIVSKKTMNVTEFGNTCENCGAYQGDWFIWHEYIDLAYDPERVDFKEVIQVPLTDKERLFSANEIQIEPMHHPRKGNYTHLCEECYKLYKKKQI